MPQSWKTLIQSKTFFGVDFNDKFSPPWKSNLLKLRYSGYIIKQENNVINYTRIQ